MAAADSKKTSENDGPAFFSSQVLIPVTVLTSSFIASFYLYRSYFRRIPNHRRLPDSFIKNRTLLGKVTSVGDGDNFHFYHTPGGILAGWGWLRHAPKTNQRGLANQTIHIRLNGVDAPEAAHFGKPAQKYCYEALEWLRSYVLGRRVRILPLARDQYDRIVAEAKVLKWTGRKNVSEEMLKAGWAVVYEAKTGAEFNGKKERFLRLESQSRAKRRGIFQDKKLVTPGQYKKMYR